MQHSVGSLVDLTRDRVRAMRSRATTETHPAEPRVSERNIAWARQLGLVTSDIEAARVAAIRCGSFAAHTYPCASEEVVQLGADLILWLYLFDDRVGEGKDAADSPALARTLDSYLEVLRTTVLPAEPTVFHESLSDIVWRARHLGADAAWVSRFATSMQSYFEGCVRELPYRRAGRIPSLSAYRSIRAQSVGAYPVFDLIELASEQLLSDDDAALSELASARELSARLCAWVNDVYSFPKERRDRDPMNLVAVIAREYALSDADALEQAVEVFNIVLDVLDAMAAVLRAKGVSAALDAYVGGLEDWVHGNRAWTGLCGRYT